MRAVVYQGPNEIEVQQVDDPRIEDPTDVIVRITTTAICGSDLHMYEGRTAAEPGIVFGHENLGVVEEVGPGVATVNQGDRVVMPFNVACGFCKNCRGGNPAFCLTVNPPGAGGAYGYVGMGPYRGGQAEYLRVPFADYNCVQLPPGEEHEQDFAMLADIFATGYHATQLADVRPGETVAVYGAGPVGLMAAYSAIIRGAAPVYVVDKVPDRLRLAERIGAVPIDYSKGDAVEQIKDRNGGQTDKGIDAVGYQATVAEGEEQPALVLNNVVDTVRPTGTLGVVGLYLTSDPGAPDENAAQGRLLFDIGKFFEKGLRMGTGQANSRMYSDFLRDLIIQGKAEPSFVVSKEVPLDQAADAYARFDRREEGYSKVVLKPAA
ncbi:glutathione-independent formaldehyde dehydrogenase [Phytoactinopolyspora halotolerans]|uniref:Alcohol dehydrogenase catalytic domain-containing protein n=1 Tax=Phytoactinopolyspora halotolerans TaxID=1981512 RepID=A0A6L9SAH8_9ACTN|nr:glutathione-independent formaldehyde dehydrogenase [Phytoactinopolyspora halotolerans]NEE00980.1 alcohol dehydrogenase catalytic domain-containing protein [Phytoactinopolyspora halotolerans]